jgi:CubicO group peptidase (beta-lactamase class C family)
VKINLILFTLIFLSGFQENNLKEIPVLPGCSDSQEFHWQYATPESQGMSKKKLDDMLKVLEDKGTKKLMIIRNDKIVYEWYANGWSDTSRNHYTASLAKALVGGMSLLAALDDGFIYLDAPACYYIPSWKKDNIKSKITIRQLATHTSGIEDAEASPEQLEDIMSRGLNHHMDLPGWKGQFWRQEPDPFLMARDSAPVIFTPGERFAYSNPGLGLLTYAVTASLNGSFNSNLRDYLRDRVYNPLGIKESEYSIGYGKTFNLDGLKLVASWGGGSFTANGIARIGLLMLHKGNWQGRQLIDTVRVEEVTRYSGTALPSEGRGDRSDPDQLSNPFPAPTSGWYCNYDGIWNSIPRDAFGGGGAGNQHLLVIPSLNLIIVRMGDNLYDESKGEGFWLGAEKYLFNPVMDAITSPPYPESELSAEFDPTSAVMRLAPGSDNWPSTWADDNDLYTAYGDGTGFPPGTDIKLSLGLARITGNPPDVTGINIRSISLEKAGQGKHGEKASGLIMVNSVLYMLIRNAQNARLIWSSDHGLTWSEAPWRFDVSFGCPGFVNFGQNNNWAPDNYVYIFSPDEASAYKNCDSFVLARVQKDKIKSWMNYEYFAGYTGDSAPLWTDDIRKRVAIFTNPGKCYRSAMVYNKGLKRYLWCQTVQLSSSGEPSDARTKGGLGIFESENPWGPWRTIFYTREWDMGPGESSSLPCKWISRDGKICWLLFSGDDSFSLRRLIIKNHQ